MNAPNAAHSRDFRSRAAPLLAAGAAVAVLLFSGWALRALEARAFGTAPAPASIHLARLPTTIGPWTGQDVPIDPRLREATDTDDLLNRRYRHSIGRDAVGVYLAAGSRARDLARHRPEVCYPGAGWTLQNVERVTLEMPDGPPLACRIFRFSEGRFDLRQLVVLNYFIVDGVVSADISRLRWKAWRGVDAMLQVQITCPTDTLRDVQQARLAAVEFAQDAATAIRTLTQRRDRSDALAPRSASTP